jgi:hypothetical protein
MRKCLSSGSFLRFCAVVETQPNLTPLFQSFLLLDLTLQWQFNIPRLHPGTQGTLSEGPQARETYYRPGGGAGVARAQSPRSLPSQN